MDLVDSLHYLFEDEMTPASGEQQEARENLRARIYLDLYKREKYEWITKRDQTAADPSQAAQHAARDMDVVKPDEKGLKHYEYIPPTPFDPDSPNPFGGVLDAPLG